MKRMQGFSLIELMIAMTLGLLLIAGAASIFLGSRSSYGSTSGTSALSDDARFAIDFLGRATRSTGFIGCIADNNNQQARVVVDSSVATSLATDFGNVLSGYDATGTSGTGTVSFNPTTTISWDNTASDWSPALPSGTTNVEVSYNNATGSPGPGLEAVTGSDILVVHNSMAASVAPDLPEFVTSTVNIGAGTINVNSTAANSLTTPAFNLSTVNVLAITDCVNSGVVFAPTSAPAGGTAINVPGTVFASYSYGAGAQITVPSTSVFFIGPGADGDAALWRADYNISSSNIGSAASPPVMTATELVPDVENMQILYGADFTAANAVGGYYSASQLTTTTSPPYANDPDYTNNTAFFSPWNAVESVRIGLLVASPPNAAAVPSSAQSYTVLGTTVTVQPDTRRRQVYEFNIAIRDALH